MNKTRLPKTKAALCAKCSTKNCTKCSLRDYKIKADKVKLSASIYHNNN